MPSSENKTSRGDYSARHLSVLEGLEAVRKRPGMYIGSTDQRGLMHCVWEIVDNAVDEALEGHGDDISVTVHDDGSIEVRDNGRGVPVDIEPSSGLTGVEHVERVARTKLAAAGADPDSWDSMDERTRHTFLAAFFAGGHDVIIGRRHFTDDAHDTTGLAASGTLSVAEHRVYTRLAIHAMHSLYEANRWVRYVAVFQNWLRPAGASFDHLHKQLVGIDERGVTSQLELQKVRANPNLYNEMAVDYAAYQGLLVASNEHAVAFAGFGHRYPTLEVYSTSATCEPWLMSRAEVDAVADLVHALHAATGADVPSNEEWHHKPLDVDQPMPWHITLKWRVSTLAGFEGGTKIYLTTIDPWTLRDRVVGRLEDLRADRL
ncbi:MAG: DUF4921 family protein, partial [Actinomyces sp.]